MEKIEEAVGGIGLLILIFLVFIAAVLRWFKIDMSWSTDLAQLTFAWICFIGADLAMKKNKHMGVDMLVNKLSPSLQNIIYLISTILVACFLVVVIYYGIDICIKNFQRQFNTLPITYSAVTASAPAGCFLMLITSVNKIIDYVKNLIRNDYSSLIKYDEIGGDIL